MIGLKNYIESTFKRFIFNIIRRRKEIFPKILSVEFTSACNAKCIMCPQPDMDRKKENMSRETLDKIIKDCKGMPLKKINLFWMGDSTVDKKMIEKIRIIRKELPSVKLYLSTNAQLLGEERSRILLDEDLLDVINFDIDGLTKSTFEGIRVRLDFDTVTDNVKYFLNYKKSLNKTKPQTRVTEALSNGWKLYGEPKMTFDKKRGVMRCGQAVIKNAPKKKYSKKINLSSI